MTTNAKMNLWERKVLELLVGMYINTVSLELYLEVSQKL